MQMTMHVIEKDERFQIGLRACASRRARAAGAPNNRTVAQGRCALSLCLPSIAYVPHRCDAKDCRFESPVLKWHL